MGFDAFARIRIPLADSITSSVLWLPGSSRNLHQWATAIQFSTFR